MDSDSLHPKRLEMSGEPKVAPGTGWREEYRRKFVSPEEAVRLVRSGDTIAIPIDTPALALSRALIQRQKDLENVTVTLRRAAADLGWFSGDLGTAFKVLLDTQPGAGTSAINERRLDFLPYLTSLRLKGEGDPRRTLRGFDGVLLVVSPPDPDGYCNFGPYLSHKRDYARRAKYVLAEVCEEPGFALRTPGDNRIHVSEITHFVRHEPPVRAESRPQPQPGPAERRIAEYVGSIARDGDCLQLGPGFVVSSLVPLGAFDGRQDLGVHSALIDHGLIDLIKRGIITGRHKNVNPGQSVSVGFRRITPEDLPFIDGNPHFLMRDMSYVNDLGVIASNDNLVAICGALAIDLAGQIASDGIGTRAFGGAGGQVEFVMGAAMSRGGASILVLHSATSGARASRIVPVLEPGTVVSIPRTFADFVVTEHGVARLWGKSQRERAAELIAIAHPAFREELARQAKELFG